MLDMTASSINQNEQTANGPLYHPSGMPVIDTPQESAEYNRQVANGTYSGRDLQKLLANEIKPGQSIWDVLHVRTLGGRFEDLRIGDWVDITLKDTYNTVCTIQDMRFVLAHINPYHWCGDSPMKNHLVFVASRPVVVAATVPGTINTIYLKWNIEVTNNGTAKQQAPYLCSNLKTWENMFEAVLPDDLSRYIKIHRMMNETRYSPTTKLSNANSWIWDDLGKIWSLSEVEVFGQNIWSKPGYATGLDCQFDLFRDASHRLGTCRFAYWLRTVAADSTTGVCYVHSFGLPAYSSPTHQWIRPRPCFILG